jgi:hypothetical protein
MGSLEMANLRNHRRQDSLNGTSEMTAQGKVIHE